MHFLYKLFIYLLFVYSNNKQHHRQSVINIFFSLPTLSEAYLILHNLK